MKLSAQWKIKMENTVNHVRMGSTEIFINYAIFATFQSAAISFLIGYFLYLEIYHNH